MERYLNHKGDSGVTGYELGPDSIRVWFGQANYYYDHSRPGQNHVDNMKVLAVSGRGLGTYISRYVQEAYVRKE